MGGNNFRIFVNFKYLLPDTTTTKKENEFPSRLKYSSFPFSKLIVQKKKNEIEAREKKSNFLLFLYPPFRKTNEIYLKNSFRSIYCV